MTGLEKLEQEIYYTYHDKKNREPLPTVILFSIICIILKGAIFYEIAIWFIYYSWCKANNDKLNSDIQNLAHRKFLLDFRKKIVSGELKFETKWG